MSDARVQGARGTEGSDRYRDMTLADHIPPPVLMS